MLVRSIVLGFVVTAGLLLSSSQAAAQDERSFIDFSNPEFTLSAGLTLYENSVGDPISPGLGGGSIFAGSAICLETGGVDAFAVDLMGGGLGFGGGYSNQGGWPWDEPPPGAPGGPGGGGAQEETLALTHGKAWFAELLLRPTWLLPGLQGERLKWNLVGGVGVHSQSSGEPAASTNGLPTWGIEGQTNLLLNVSVTTEWTVNDALGVRAQARMNWMQRDDPVFIQPGGSTVVNQDGGSLSWGTIMVGLTFRPRGASGPRGAAGSRGG